MINLNLNIEKALTELLCERYKDEFYEDIDGLSQHPKGINFYEWLYEKNFITKEKLSEINIVIENEEE